MDGSTAAPLIGIIVLVCGNITAVAYSYGKLNQKVSDLCRRLDRIDARLNADPPPKQ